MAAATSSCNPAFDPRITKLPFGGQGILRGHMTSVAAVNGQIRGLNFLYNPSDLTWDGSVDSNVVGNSQVLNPLDTGIWLMPMSQTVTFSLLFDRTYETWLAGGTSDAAVNGVGADVKALYAMIGVMGDAGNAGVQSDDGAAPATGTPLGTAPTAVDTTKALTNSNTTISLASTSASPQSFMQYVPIVVVLNHQITFHGVLQEAVVTYTHFTQQMVPNRCSIDISMQLFPVTTATAPTAAALPAANASSFIYNANTWGPLAVPAAGTSQGTANPSLPVGPGNWITDPGKALGIPPA